MKRVALVLISLMFIALGVVSAQKRKARAAAVSPAPQAQEQSPASNPEPLTDRVMNPGQTASVEFQSMTDAVLASLPKRAELRDLTTAQVHLAPTPVLHAGSLLSRVAQALHDNPSLGQLGADFYKKCTSDQEFVTSVRALCYARLRARDPLVAVEVPANVRYLAQQIMN